MKVRIQFASDFSKWSNPELVYILSTLLGTKDPNKSVKLDIADSRKLAKMGYDKKSATDNLKNVYNQCKTTLMDRTITEESFCHAGDISRIATSKDGYYYPPANIIMEDPSY